MIKSYTITTDRGGTITLEMTRPEKSGFIIASVDGLGPTKSNINTTKTATSHGSLYNSARLDQRNITMSLIFYETATESIEDIRHKSYEYFPINERIEITIETDKRIVKTEGYVETNEPNIYSSMEGCNISILCPDPFFYSASTTTTTFSGIEPAFEFPFDNTSYAEPTLEFSHINNKTVGNVLYEGNFEAPMVINMHATSDVSNITIYNIYSHEQMRIDTTKLEAMTGSEVKAGDTIIIDTKPDNLSAILIRDGVRLNILNCINRDADWFMLKKGVNTFSITADEGKSSLQFYIENKTVYTGV